MDLGYGGYGILSDDCYDIQHHSLTFEYTALKKVENEVVRCKRDKNHFFGWECLDGQWLQNSIAYQRRIRGEILRTNAKKYNQDHKPA